MLSRNFDTRENSLLIRNRSRSPDTRNPPTTPQPEIPPRHRVVKTDGGTFVTYPTFWISASLSHGSPYLPLRPHSYTKAAKTRETPCSSVGLPTAAQPETLPRRRCPPQQLVVPHPPHRMRIHRRSRHPTGSAAPSSTSKELPRRSPRLSRHLNPHSAVLTCPTGTTTPSPIPPMKPTPTRRQQGGSSLTAAFYLLFDLTGLPVLDTE